MLVGRRAAAQVRARGGLVPALGGAGALAARARPRARRLARALEANARRLLAPRRGLLGPRNRTVRRALLRRGEAFVMRALATIQD